MLTKECEALHFYNDQFRDLINGKAQRHNGESEHFDEFIKKLLS